MIVPPNLREVGGTSAQGRPVDADIDCIPTGAGQRHLRLTGVKSGNLLKGVSYFKDGALTNAINVHTHCTHVRFVETIHLLSHDCTREIWQRTREIGPRIAAQA